MEAVDALKSVLCGPDGKCCIAGSQADRDTVDTALAAIQHYLDQRAKDLPELPPTKLYKDANGVLHPTAAHCRTTAEMEAYGQQCAAHARELALACIERDTLRAELAAIAATEPDSYRLYDDATGVSIFYPRVRLPKSIDEGWEIRPLFTRPMPAQGVNAELVEAFEYHIEQTRPIERSTIALSKYKE